MRQRVHQDLLRQPRDGDQAQGLRRLFAARPACHIVLAANPHVAFAGVMLERLSTALGLLGAQVLVVDAADTSPAAHELAQLDLATCIEPLSAQVSYLAARGLPRRHVDTRGSSAQLLERLHAAAPKVDAVLLHADAADLVRLFGRQAPRVLLLAGESSESLTHAYAGMKLMTQRCGLLAYDLLLAAPPRLPRAKRIAECLSGCADRFLGAVLHDWVAIDPATDVREAPSAPLLRLVAALLHSDDETATAEPPCPAAWTAPRARPALIPH